jgi:hypothetical protein
MQWVLHLLSYLVFTHFTYTSYLPYLYNRTVSTVYRTHFGLCRYLVFKGPVRSGFLTLTPVTATATSCPPIAIGHMLTGCNMLPPVQTG